MPLFYHSKVRITRIALSVAISILSAVAHSSAEDAKPILKVKRISTDYEVTGNSDAKVWQHVSWTSLHLRTGEHDGYEARVKLQYSATGIYVLMNSKDRKITATFEKDFENLWTEDVFEFFFWTDERWPIYFEYEISPLGRELPIIIPNFDGKFYGWRPWHYANRRKTKKAVTVRGGKQESGATIREWTAEVYVPYDLFNPLQNVPPKSGTRWRANFYRMDYDDGKESSWDWARVGPSFHEYKKFGTLVFE